MIYNNLLNQKNLPQERIDMALRFLQETDLESLAPGSNIQIDGDNVYAMVQEYMTEPVDTRKFETHNKYIDIQYIVSGEEFFSISPRDNLFEDSPYNPDKDISFYINPTGPCTEILLRSGDYVIVHTNEAHRPKCMVGSPGKVKKIVLKVKV